ncbi:MAG: hypothetical protein HUK18_05650 [Bacteroidales bacterium]|nr:hypothetical protein [Bacteroidales bacterium]
MKKITLFLALTAFMFNAFAQKYGATPDDSTECIMNLSLYTEYYKQNQWKDAYEPWKAVIQHCPANHTNNYVRGAKILSNLYATASTAEEREKYFNEMLWMNDVRGEAMGDKGNCIARKAQIYQQYKPADKETPYNLYQQAAELAGKDLDQQYCVLYLKSTIEYLAAKKASTEEMAVLFDVYDYASETMDFSLTEQANDLDSLTQLGDTKKIEKAQKTFDNTRSNIVALETLIEPYAKCEDIIPIFEGRFKANPNDVTLLKKITTALSGKNCTESELFFSATENLHKLEPTPKSAFLMGQMLLGKKDFEQAAKYLAEAEETSPEIGIKAKAAYKRAEALMFAKSYSAARESARKAANYDKSLLGKASLLISRMYLATPGANAAYAAYDEAAKAKSLDPAVASEAQKVMNSAHGRFQTKENLFFEGITPGSSIAVGGWIGGSATVRTR